LDWWRSSRIHPAEPMAGTLLRPAMVERVEVLLVSEGASR
jgi:hypothetical protein